jgi:two-component system nitrate/nitrite response regulator NarL
MFAERSIKILVVDDHELVRKGISGLMSKLNHSVDVYEAGTLEEVLLILAQSGPMDIVLLDVVLPDSEGLKGLNSIKQQFPESPVVLVSAITDRSLVHEALEAGVDGYITKTSSADIFLNAIRLVLSGDIYVPSFYLGFQSSNEVSSAAQSGLDELINKLTPRQIEVLQLLEEGLSNKEIGSELACTESTVKTHISAIFKLLEVSSRGKLVALLVKLRDPQSSE